MGWLAVRSVPGWVWLPGGVGVLWPCTVVEAAGVAVGAAVMDDLSGSGTCVAVLDGLAAAGVNVSVATVADIPGWQALRTQSQNCQGQPVQYAAASRADHCPQTSQSLPSFCTW